MIILDRLSTGYDRKRILSSVSATLPDGKLTGIIGPNGCGKSTLLKAICGILPATEGKILLDGQDIRSLSRRKKAQKISFLPQMRIPPDMTVEILASHGRYPHLGARRILSPADQAHVEKALLETQAISFRHQPLQQLSGGERQRAYLAMLLAQNASHMLLDEPTTYLDPESQFELMGLLRRLAWEGRAIAVVLHDLPLAMHECDELLVMEKDKPIIQGTPEELLEKGVPESIFHVKLHKTEAGHYAISKI